MTAPVIATEQIFVAAIDRHTLYALDVDSGQIRWSYMAGANGRLYISGISSNGVLSSFKSYTKEIPSSPV